MDTIHGKWGIFVTIINEIEFNCSNLLYTDLSSTVIIIANYQYVCRDNLPMLLVTSKLIIQVNGKRNRVGIEI